MVDGSFMADEVADAFGGPSFSTLMILLVLILILWVGAAGALPPPPPSDGAAAPGGRAYAAPTRLWLIVLAAAGYAFWRVMNPKGQAILIVGPSNAGKTALFMRVGHAATSRQSLSGTLFGCAARRC